MLNYIYLEQIQSTNTYLKGVAESLTQDTVAYTHCQTAGRGQKGNSWEAEPGKNLTFSLLLKNPAVPVAKQFLLSEATSVAICLELSEFADGFSIKWPNDIYWRDRKICGILIENSLSQSGIDYSVIGVGLNVNQEVFISDAPNPVSLKNITDADYDLEELLRTVCERIETKCAGLRDTESWDSLHSLYRGSLYRNDGKLHPFQLPDGTRFRAAISDVLPDGALCLADEEGFSRQFQFKEVKHVIESFVL